MVFTKFDQQHILCNKTLHETPGHSQGKIMFKIWIGIFYCVCSNFVFIIQLCPRITMAMDDIITVTDDVIHTICIDLEGKLMCCKKFACFYDNKFPTSNLFSRITQILMQQLLHSNQKYAVGHSFFKRKNI